MTNKRTAPSKIAFLAGLLLSIPCANASFIEIPQPDATYTSSTTLIPITGADGDVTSTLSDANLTVTFSTPMQVFTVPTTWSNWGSPPATESSTPKVLSPEDFTLTSITLTFSHPLTTFGLEAEPDALAIYGQFPVTLTFFNGATQIGAITRSIDGASAALFAATSTTPITSAVLAVGGNQAVPEGSDPGLAQVRYALADVTPPGVPEPATCFTGLAVFGVLVVRHFRSVRS